MNNNSGVVGHILACAAPHKLMTLASSSSKTMVLQQRPYCFIGFEMFIFLCLTLETLPCTLKYANGVATVAHHDGNRAHKTTSKLLC